MENVLLIESRDPFEARAVESDYEMAAALARAGRAVSIFLVQNGVLPARRSASSEPFARLLASGVEVLADDFSLRERGIGHLADGVSAVSIDVVVDRLADGQRVLWL